MKIQFLVVIAALFICCLGGGVAGQSPGDERKVNRATDSSGAASVDQILDRYVQAIGGAAAHRKLTSRVIKETFVIEDSDVTASYESYRQAPNKAVVIGQFKLGNGSTFEVSRGFDQWSVIRHRAAGYTIRNGQLINIRRIWQEELPSHWGALSTVRDFAKVGNGSRGWESG